MNFFEHQEKARKKSGNLLLLLGVAVLSMIVVLYLAVRFSFIVAAQKESGIHPGWWNLETFALVSILVLAIVIAGSLYKIAMLSRGGSWVAESLGGVQVLPSTKDPLERRYLNVVEEMALASGIAMPAVYLLPNESGINAFAAGNKPSDAAVAVTRGALTELSRDELQGVVAHEFSHIVNGDMRLNIKLMGLIAGILVLGVIGRIILSSASRGGRNSKGKGGLLVAGLALLIVGYTGVLVGRLIQAAISRQREFLADASAVQFTRNPVGIGGALKRIAGHSEQSLVGHAGAAETSHMFFGQACSGFAARVFATHPPLEERIKRLDPRFNPELEAMARSSSKSPKGAAARGKGPGVGAGVSGFAGAEGTGEAIAGGDGGAKRGRFMAGDAGGEAAVAGTGRLTEETLASARGISATIPAPVREMLEHPMSATALLVSLMLDSSASKRLAQMELVRRSLGEGMVVECERALKSTSALPAELRLPLVDLATPALGHLSVRQAGLIRKLLQELAESDSEVTLWEACLLLVVGVRLPGAALPAVRFNDIRQVGGELSTLLSLLALAGGEEQAERAFRAGLKGVSWAETPALSRGDIDGRELSRVLSVLAATSMSLRRIVLRSCAQTVLSDREVTNEEAELVRAVAYCLGLPLPPFLPAAA